MKSSPDPTAFDHLRAQAAMSGVDPTDADLADVLGFLQAILPALAEIERTLPPESEPAGPADAGAAT